MPRLVFARLGKLIPRSGGPYAYARAGFGEFAGFLVAWAYWISMWTTNAALAVAFVSYSTVFFPVLASEPLLGAAAALAVIWFLTFVNVWGVRPAGFVQVITVILKLLPLAAIILTGFFFFDASHFQPFNRSGQAPLSAISATVTLTLWAFLGLESGTVPADDVHDAERTIPRATLLGTGREGMPSSGDSCWWSRASRSTWQWCGDAGRTLNRLDGQDFERLGPQVSVNPARLPSRGSGSQHGSPRNTATWPE